MKNQNKIAYCIPTYNRPEQIDGVLRNSLDILKKYGIDVYIYDSSSNNETKIISEKYICYENLHYIKLPPETVQIDKLKMIYTGIYQIKDYDYVWLVKDRVFFSEDLISRVNCIAETNPDAIFLRAIETKHTLNLTDDYYDDPIKLYHDWGWLMTSWDVLLLSRKKILNKINWNNILKKYTIDKDINFIPVVILFNILSETKKCSVPVLDAQAGKYLFNLPVPGKNIDSTVFRIWGYIWYHTNMNLPEIYNDEKAFVIKSAASLPWLIGNQIRLMNIWKNGCLTDEKLACVKDIWGEISDVPWQDVCRIKDGDKIYMEECFTELVWDLLDNNQMGLVEYYYSESLWLKDDISTKAFQYTIYMIEIYMYERQNGDIHIFDGGQNREYVFLKIETVIKFVKLLEEFDNIQSENIKAFIKNKIISISMIEYLITKSCKDLALVVERFNKFINS